MCYYGGCSNFASRRFSPDIDTRFVYSILRIAPGIVGGRIKLNVPPAIDFMKHATTSDHDNRGTPVLSRGCLLHVLLWWVQ